MVFGSKPNGRIKIAAGALMLASLGMFATPALASARIVRPATVENTKCVDIDFVGNAQNGRAAVEVLSQNCSGEVGVRSWETCQTGFLQVTVYGPMVRTVGTTSVADCASAVEPVAAWGWQYDKDGTWYPGYNGAPS